MKLVSPDDATLQAALAGDLAALDRLLATIQPGVHNLAVRILGSRDDAADATQEILLKVVTHLAGFRGEAAFATWVWRVAHNHLMTARTRAAEAPTVSLDALAERLDAGLDWTAARLAADGADTALTPEDKLEARQVALSCTQSMLMALDREQRLAYVIDTVFELPSHEAAAVVGTTAAAWRQRVSRARARLDAFAQQRCGLANPAAACRCERQLPALRQAAAQGRPRAAPLALQRVERAEVEAAFDAFTQLSDAAALFRAHPDYRAPETMRAAIRAVLAQTGFLQRERPQ